MTDVRAWQVRGLVKELLHDIRTQPFALGAAYLVVPTVWGVPADLAYDYVVPPEGEASGTSPVALLMLLAITAWSCLLYGGELRIAIGVARGGRVDWSQFRKGMRLTGRLMFTALPIFVPLAVFLNMPEGEWLEVWALPLGAILLGCAIVFGARTVLWAPSIADRDLSLGHGLRISWRSTRGQLWRIVRLGMVLGGPVLPVLILETVAVGRPVLSVAVLGGLSSLAMAKLYLVLPLPDQVVASDLPSPDLTVSNGPSNDEPFEADPNFDGANVDAPRVGSGWSRPFD